MDFNGLLQAGTGLLQGKTQGELYQREQERKRIEMLADQMHNTVELAKAQDLLKTGSQNRALALNVDRRAESELGLRQQAAAHRGEHIPYGPFQVIQRGNLLADQAAIRQQNVGFAGEDVARYNADFTQDYGTTPVAAAQVRGGSEEILPGGYRFVKPNLPGQAEQATKEANASRAAALARVAGVDADRVEATLEAEGGYAGLVGELQADLAAGRIRRQADTMRALLDWTRADREMKLDEATTVADVTTAEIVAGSRLAAARQWAHEWDTGQTDLPFEQWIEYLPEEAKSKLRIDEIMASGMADAAVASVTRTSRHDSYTHADPAAVELGFAEVGARNYETDVRREGQQAGTTTGDGPGKVQTPAQEDPEEEPEDSGWGESP